MKRRPTSSGTSRSKAAPIVSTWKSDTSTISRREGGAVRNQATARVVASESDSERITVERKALLVSLVATCWIASAVACWVTLALVSITTARDTRVDQAVL